ncbi:hypothetical protein [Streptomyces laurentii]|uniref:hypothetical protein n=1 Tax=Streptomyces laurentii TaxID=39478 RepID=UPI00368CECD6
MPGIDGLRMVRARRGVTVGPAGGRSRGIVVPAVTAERIDDMCSYRSVLELGALRPALARDADFSAARPALVHRHLLDRLLVGGETAIRALEDDPELGGRAAMHLALRRRRGVPAHLG